MYHKKGKRGISTVLGVLLGIGVFFTTIIPVYIYVNQVNNYYDRTVVDMKIADQERSMEDLDVYAFGSSETSEDIDVFLINRGALSLKVTHIWVMRTDLQETLIFTSQNSSLPLQLIASAQTTIANLSLTDIIENITELDKFSIEVTTARGNTFPSSTNPLQYNGGWLAGTNPPWIEIIIRSDWGLDEYNATAVNKESGLNYTRSTTKGTHGDWFTIVPVFDPGFYDVIAYNTKENYLIGTKEVNVENYNPVALAYFDDLS